MNYTARDSRIGFDKTEAQDLHQASAGAEESPYL